MTEVKFQPTCAFSSMSTRNGGSWRKHRTHFYFKNM